MTHEAPGPPPPPPPHRRRPIWRAVGITFACSLAAVAIAANFIRVPYVIISPGEATPLDERVVNIEGATTYAHGGEVLFLTVRVTNRDPSLWRYLFAQIDGDVSVDKREEVFGCATYEESARINELLMTESQDIAKTVALEKLGYPVVRGAVRVVIDAVLCDGPAEGRLMLGDIVLAVDGQPITTAEEVAPLIRAHQPGDEIDFTVDRGGTETEVNVVAGELEGETIVGVRGRDVTEEQFPFEINIDTQRVSGPSAGLAFTIAIIDDLTPGDLMGGNKVAVTGSILPDGSVAPVGGVEQKAITARRNGASLMLVPSGEGRLAREHADGMRVVVVKTIDDALEALDRFGGDALPDGAGTQTGT